MSDFQFKRAFEFIRTAKHPVLIADERIDPDALGATLTLASFFASQGIFAPVFVSEPVSQKYQFLPCVSHCTTNQEVLQSQEIDLVIVCDCSDASYVERLLLGKTGNYTLINIDHHNTNTAYGNVALVDKTAPAASYLVYQLLKMAGVTITKNMATGLLFGIAFDTNVFLNSSADERAFAAASELVLLGAQSQQIVQVLYANRPIEALRVWGQALCRLQKHAQGGLVTYLTQKDLVSNGVSEEEVEGLSNFLHLVCPTKVLQVVRETAHGDVKVSLRSLEIDVGEMARLQGGGGHTRAAGYCVQNASLKEQDDGTWTIVVE